MKNMRYNPWSFLSKCNFDKHTREVIKFFLKVKPKMLAELKGK